MQTDALAWALAQPGTTVWNRLAEAYASGAMRVRFADGREVTYASTADMERILATGYAASLTVTQRRPLSVVARVGDGFA
jgi:hypothetical protein